MEREGPYPFTAGKEVAERINKFNVPNTFIALGGNPNRRGQILAAEKEKCGAIKGTDT